jgi:hypothetical protein
MKSHCLICIVSFGDGEKGFGIDKDAHCTTLGVY